MEKEKYVEVNEELQRTVKGKDEFLLSVSHELRNPLNILLGNLELGQMSKPDQVNKYLSYAKTSGEMLAFLINNLLDAGKLQTKNLEVSTAPTNIYSFVERIWSVSQMMFQRKSLNGQLYFAKDIPTALSVDPHRMMQIVINLVSNATKFTFHGGVTIIISWIEQDQFDDNLLDTHESEELSTTNYRNLIGSKNISANFDDQNEDAPLTLDGYTYPTKFKSMGDVNLRRKFHKIDFHTQTLLQSPQKEKNKIDYKSHAGFFKIEVRDTGCGIDKDKLPKLFSKFSQVSQNSEQQQLGTGLGLWIVQNLCQSMGGSVKAYSVKDSGSNFVAVIKSHSLPPAPEISPGKPSKQLRALIADDMKSNADIHKYFLNKCGVEVSDIASTGVEAVELYRKRGDGYYDIVFMDRSMPLMDGDRASELIRSHEQEGGWKTTILVIITGHCKKEDHDALQSSEGTIKANYVFLKPFNFQVCRDLISAIKSKDCVPQNIKPSKKILVVDDDKFQVQIMTEYLSKLNVQSLVCYNGKEALDMFYQHHQDICLVFTDCEMPIMNGYETAKNLKLYCRRNKLKCPPIIGLTGHADFESKKRCLQAGMDVVEIKPISFGHLQKTIQRM
jgi:signal transduction histidine kinase/DNA-binding response OmpR family regulator